MDYALVLVAKWAVDPQLGPCTRDVDIQIAYDAWVAGFYYDGGCNVETNIATIPQLVLSDINCGGQLTFTYMVQNGPERRSGM